MLQTTGFPARLVFLEMMCKSFLIKTFKSTEVAKPLYVLFSILGKIQKI